MFKNYVTFFFLTTSFFLFSSCEKSSSDTAEPALNTESHIEKVPSPKQGPNDEKYVASIKRFARNFKNKEVKNGRVVVNQCATSGQANVYGFYDDPEDLIIEGSYTEAGTVAAENAVENCDSMAVLIEDAKIYLLSEGYSDIVNLFYGTPRANRLTYAANALVDLKQQYSIEWARTANQAKIGNCIFQALGFSALAELGANWATASRQVLLKAVGKLATRYLGWFGAAIAVVSFVDCMWG